MSGGPVFLPRVKPRRTLVSLGYRAYAAARHVLPGRVVFRNLLELSWLFKQLAWDEAWRCLPPFEALALTRPHAQAFVLDNVPEGATVVDLAGGSGLASRFAAKKAARVLYVDASAENASAARRNCEGADNVAFRVGDLFEVLEREGPFDVAILFHALGYFEDPVAALARIGRKAGRILVEVPDFASDALNAGRLREVLPCYTDFLYRVEFAAEHLEACIHAAGLALTRLETRNGCLLAIANAPEED